MPESEKRELGGLARSIDALFSQARAAAPSAEPSLQATEQDTAVASDALADPVEDGAGAVPETEPDPFESLQAYAGDTEVVEPAKALSFTDVEMSQEVVWEAVEEAEVVLDVEDVVDLEPDIEPEAVAGPEPLPVEEPSGPSLAELVEAYLAGEPGAAEQVRAEAVTLQERMALDPLADAVEALVHSNGDAPSEEAVALAQDVLNPAVASRLAQRMGHEDDDERRRGYLVLSQRIGTVMAKAFRGALTDATDPRARRAFYDALIAMGETSRPMIEAMVEDDNRFLVRNAVAILGEIGGERAVELVTSALANTDARVRREALNSLAKIGGDQSAQLVVGFLEDPSAEVRAAAASAAGTLKVERALKPILGLLEDEDDPDVLVELLGGLGRLGDPGAVQAIEKRAVGSLFSKPATEVRVAAYRALHDIGTPHARELITKAREDKDPVVRTTARQLTPTG